MSFISIKDKKDKILIAILLTQSQLIESKWKIGIGIIIRGKIDLRRTSRIILEQSEFIK